MLGVRARSVRLLPSIEWEEGGCQMAPDEVRRRGMIDPVVRDHALRIVQAYELVKQMFG